MVMPTETRTARKAANNADASTKETDTKITGTTGKEAEPQETSQAQKQKEQTPATENLQPREEKRGGGHHRGTETAPTSTSHHTAERQRRRQTPTEGDQTCHPRLTARKEEKEKTLNANMTKRKHTTWEDVGLIEYNPQTARWECRFGHCRHIASAKQPLYQRRNKDPPDHSLGKTRNLITYPYCSKTYTSHERLLMRTELAKKAGSRNTEIYPNLNVCKTPNGGWANVLLKMKGNMPELRMQPAKSPLPIPADIPNGVHGPTA